MGRGTTWPNPGTVPLRFRCCSIFACLRPRRSDCALAGWMDIPNFVKSQLFRRIHRPGSIFEATIAEMPSAHSPMALVRPEYEPKFKLQAGSQANRGKRRQKRGLLD